ncbi:MAG: hypothetical protein K2X86_13180 [Cytophagaceae bacterium]|nr:hypothetical protein [Cytophagaceae bacterium]
MVPKRICIYPKDVQNITGRKEKTARRLLNKIKNKLGKSKEGFITVQEFCQFTGIPEDEVTGFLID